MQQYQINNTTGECSTCKKKITNEKIKCVQCEAHYHATCSPTDPICRITFLNTFHTSTIKPNFTWTCDACLTRLEENKVSSLSEQLGALKTTIDSLVKAKPVDKSEEITTLISQQFALLTEVIVNDIKVRFDVVKQDISNEVNTKISDEFKKFDESQTVRNTPPMNTPPMNTVWDKKEKLKEIRASLLVKRSTGNGRAMNIAGLEQTAVDNGIPVNSVHVTEAGDTFINLPNKSSSDRLEPLLRESAPDNEVITLKSKLPSIALLGVTQEYTKTQIVNMIKSQNEVVNLLVEDGSHLSVIFTKPPGEGEDKPYHQVVLRVSPDIRRAIANHQNKIHMGKLVHRVVDRFYVRRCNLCQCFGHYKDKCPTPDALVCGYCTETTHNSKDCPKKSGPTRAFSCNNCKLGGHDHQGHSTFWHNCPAYKAQQKKLERAIDYDYPN